MAILNKMAILSNRISFWLTRGQCRLTNESVQTRVLTRDQWRAQPQWAELRKPGLAADSFSHFSLSILISSFVHPSIFVSFCDISELATMADAQGAGHFCCWNCDNSLTGQRYILRDDHSYCIKCHDDLFANTCQECNKRIGTDSKDLSYKEQHWHEVCFKCSNCKCSLVEKHFASKNEKLYCPSCHDQLFAPRCDHCGDIFKAGMKKFEYRNMSWHEHCFCCLSCKKPIGAQSFIPKDAEVVCIPCYEEKFATRCIKCQGVINKGGVTYRMNAFHKPCFTCTNCNKELAGLKFTSKDEAPYCAECYGELFAKKCTRCAKPITGIGSTKFISFEGRHWHSDCFNCYDCNASLVGKGFLTDDQAIMCPPCGNKKPAQPEAVPVQ